MSLLGDLIGMSLDNSAAKKQARLQQELLNKGAALSRDEFDKRMATIGGSDQRLLDLARRQPAETGAEEDSRFKFLLDNDRQGFDEAEAISNETADERLGIESGAFDEQMSAAGDLITAQRASRLKNQAVSEAERQRQRGFQGDADEVTGALPGQIGFDAQTAGRSRAFGDRSALIRANTTAAGPGPAFAKDPALAGAFAAQDQRGTGEGLGDALGAAKFSSYGDAYRGAERGIGQAADDISALTSKAAFSRDALPAELGVGKLEASQAGERADFATELSSSLATKRDGIAGDRGQRRTGVSEQYRGAQADSRTNNSNSIMKMLDDYFGGTMDAEQGFINGASGISRALEEKLLSLNNFKMGNTKVTSPLAKVVGFVDAAGDKAASAMMGGG